MSRVKKSAEEIEEAKLLGKALAALRVSRGMTQGQVAELAGLNPQRICKAERGQFYPRHSSIKRILAGMGVTFATLHRAQELVADPMGEVAEPMDTPDFTPEEAHQAAVRWRRKPERRSPTAACRSWRWALAAGGCRPAPATVGPKEPSSPLDASEAPGCRDWTASRHPPRSSLLLY